MCHNPRMVRFSSVIVLLSLGLSGCGHLGSRGAAPAVSDDGQGIVLDPELRMHGQASQLAWVSYGIAKLGTVKKRQGKYHNRTADDFQIELTAHQIMVETWAKYRHEDGKPDPYLDKLIAVDKAGLLQEYVVSYFAKPGWTIPVDAIRKMDLPAFAEWQKANLVGHRPQVLAGVMMKGARVSAPGADLPDRDAISPRKFACPAMLPRLKAGMNSWLATSTRLDGTPRTAVGLEDFLGMLQSVRQDAAAFPSGVTWVLPRAFEVNFVFGWCANEARDHAAAQGALERAVALDPRSVIAHVELAHALVALKKLEPALGEAEAALALEPGKCQRAVAWRKKGFIFFEQGKLKAAYEAYQRSLEFDPGSKIAVDEMLLLAREIQKSGSLSPGDEGRYEAPPPGRQVTSTCHED